MNLFQGAEGANALKLVQRTELDHTPTEYGFDPLTEGIARRVTVRHYGGDLVEVSYGPVQGEICPSAEEREHGCSTQAESLANLSRSVRRSRAQVRRKCMAAELNHMVTLSYQENMTDVDEAYRHVARYIRLLRKTSPKLGYCIVLEFQKRGAVHFHMAVHGWQNIPHLRATWQRVLKEKGLHGGVNVQAPRGKALYSPYKIPLLAGYMSKYITKDLCSANGRQRYRVSEGIAIPSDTFLYIVERGRSIFREIMDSFGVGVAYQWEDENNPNGWACSWET